MKLHNFCENGNYIGITNYKNIREDMEEMDRYGWTPLMIACSKGHRNIIDFLLNKGANPDTSDKRDCTPLIISCKYGHLQVVCKLISIGVDLNSKDIDGVTALIMASANGHMDIVKELLVSGVDMEEWDNEGKSFYDYLNDDQKNEIYSEMMFCHEQSRINY